MTEEAELEMFQGHPDVSVPQAAENLCQKLRTNMGVVTSALNCG